jgi:hypothetical protein
MRTPSKGKNSMRTSGMSPCGIALSLHKAQRKCDFKWSGRESNPRPLHCERSALPTELPPHFVHRSKLAGEGETAILEGAERTVHCTKSAAYRGGWCFVSSSKSGRSSSKKSYTSLNCR